MGLCFDIQQWDVRPLAAMRLKRLCFTLHFPLRLIKKEHGLGLL